MTAQNSGPTEPLSPVTLDTRRRRLLFRANHRGTHENDLMIGGFVTPRIASFTDAEITALEEVLEYPEVVLADWLSGRRPLPDDSDLPTEHAAMLGAMFQAIHK